MKKYILINAAWLILALGAFLLGRSNPRDTAESKEPIIRKSSGKNSSSRSAYQATASSRLVNSSQPNFASGRQGSTVTVSQFLSERDPLLANRMFAELILSMDASSAGRIFEELKSRRTQGSDEQMGLFLRAWGQLDGTAAMQAVDEFEGDPRRQAGAGIAAISGWASKDPEGAKAYLDTVDSEIARGVLTQGIVSGMASTDPDGATDYVLELDQLQRERVAGADTREERREWLDRGRAYAFDRQLDTIATAQINLGMSNATAWAENLPEGTIKASAFDRVADRFASEDPTGAAEWVRSHADQDYAERAVREVAEELGRENPEAAVRWVTDLPESNQSRAINQSMERWTREDPVAAGNFLQDMAPSRSRDAAVKSYANELDGSDPQMAAEWAGSIADDQMRSETLNGVARSWIRRDPEGARAWLPASGLSSEQQERIVRDSERRQQFRARFRGGDQEE